MAGEARKAAVRWLRENGYTLWLDANGSLADMLAAYAAETREQCAQIAESEKVDYEATKASDDLAYNSAIEHVAAAIRSIAQAVE